VYHLLKGFTENKKQKNLKSYSLEKRIKKQIDISKSEKENKVLELIKIQNKTIIEGVQNLLIDLNKDSNAKQSNI
jgi:hypothetical protein